MPVVGFWKRFAAYFIDGIILSVLVTIFSIVTLVPITLVVTSEEVFLVLTVLYYIAVVILSYGYMIVLEASRMQGTIGKKILGILVVDENGERITMKKSIIRTLSKFLSGWLLYVGYIMIGVTKEKQGLHDMIAKTYCVEKDRHRI